MASGRYIVTFADSATDEQIAQSIQGLESNGGAVQNRYSLLKGFSAVIPESYLSSFKSAQGDLVLSIEPDSVVTIQ
ncbi:hypothetical protein SERLA73DRAFT_136073 [Serpula lacrymans var. lacrymans S7.3]|uniref:Inhibitor I9 domain-containing protein n=2 Tax=Serpula lacrymans var. lacrymans TaxID=341189 RepID=F8PWH4_SERL3|nr:uncharacterized protein SERLADRAFT_388423 [Serpula lacrymans var. lacrymans S7.9]EGO00298.1 hypothetical protein SERLA73DRAFT_136073 [Serpula lacrymans var. lacrymans S7.3]EGO25858.1 hypothetical protein SERLADRAFT_388423 [Serpula lacrymans var. lacrymans S7.9]